MIAWKEYTVGELCDNISDTYKRNDKQVILINTSDVSEGKVLNHLSVENKNLKGQFKKTFRRNDVLYSEIRLANKRFAYIDFDNTKNYIASTKLMVLRPRKDVVLPYFLYNILKSQALINELQHLAETRSGTFPQITFSSELAPMHVKIPDIETQRKISFILSVLDDKIELNNRINKNIEQQERAIFIKMFGDKLDDVTSSVPLGELITIIDNRGKTPPLEKQTTKYPIIDVKSLSGENRIINYNNCTKYVNDNTYNTWFRSGHPQPFDILLSTVGSLAEMKMFLGDIGCIAQNVVGLRSKGISPFYLYQYLSSIKKNLIAYNIGSVQPSIKVTHIIKPPIYLPSENELSQFSILSESITNEIYNNCIQNQRLSALRDSLLPKLINGEIDVSEIEI